MALDLEQRRILRGGAAALLVALVVLAGGYLLWPFPPPAAPTAADRLVFALKCDLFVFLWLLAAMLRVALLRFVLPADRPGAGLSEPGPEVRIARALLQNTLEQAVLALGLHLILATLLRGHELAVIPLLVLLFCIGRLCFWRGYAGGAGSRSFGFVLTCLPTVAGYLGAVVLLLVRG